MWWPEGNGSSQQEAPCHTNTLTNLAPTVLVRPFHLLGSSLYLSVYAVLFVCLFVCSWLWPFPLLSSYSTPSPSSSIVNFFSIYPSRLHTIRPTPSSVNGGSMTGNVGQVRPYALRLDATDSYKEQ